MKGFLKSFLYFMLYILATLVISIPLGIIAYIFIPNAQENKSVMMIAGGIASIIATVSVVLFYKYRNVKEEDRLLISKPKFNLKTLGISVAVAIISMILAVVIGALLSSKETNDTTKAILEMGYLGLIIGSIIAPIFEEIFFRGVIHHIMKDYHPAIYVLTSGIIFGIAHFTTFKYSTLVAIIMTTCLGFFWAIVYKKTENIVCNILGHSLYNTIILLVGILSQKG